MSTYVMPEPPVMLDLMCCAGGASMGYYRAGFRPVGADIEPQPHYPFTFEQGDCLDPVFVRYLVGKYRPIFIAASPLCRAHTLAQRIQGNQHQEQIPTLRPILQATGLPYVIENVEGAPLINPIMLCGGMFPGLGVYRHRLFETPFPIQAPPHPAHAAPLRKMGRAPQPGDFMHVVGNFSGVDQARRAMGIDWMVRDELRDAIPPAYTEYIGRELLARTGHVRDSSDRLSTVDAS